VCSSDFAKHSNVCEVEKLHLLIKSYQKEWGFSISANVADMRSFAHSLLKFNNCVRNLGERSATSEPHIVLVYAPSGTQWSESATGWD
jgi:hypothetical protein